MRAILDPAFVPIVEASLGLVPGTVLLPAPAPRWQAVATVAAAALGLALLVVALAGFLDWVEWTLRAR